MTQARLTLSGPTATIPPKFGSVGLADLRKMSASLLVAGTFMIGGCINVNAPSEPIVIELNINITQEVVYRLAADVNKTVEENADVF